MDFMHEIIQKGQTELKVINCLSDRELTRSIEMSSPDHYLSPDSKTENKLKDSKLSTNSNRAQKGGKSQKKFSKEESLRKISVLSRELSLISARHRSIR